MCILACTETTSFHFIDFQASEPNWPVWKGKKPNRNWSVWTGFRFGSVQKSEKKNNWFGYLFWFKTGPNRKCSHLLATLFKSKTFFWHLIWNAFQKFNFFFMHIYFNFIITFFMRYHNLINYKTYFFNSISFAISSVRIFFLTLIWIMFIIPQTMSSSWVYCSILK